MNPGILVISIDFEIHWGVSDHRTVESYYENLVNVPQVVKRTLSLFRQNNIHATWATVGMLMCKDKNEIFSYVGPEKRPSYNNEALSNYKVAETAGPNQSEDPFHYAASLVDEIINTEGQELATHTYSHYYCLEPGQTTEQFNSDLKAAKKIAENGGNNMLSIVFPRNQYNEDYLKICCDNDILCYRGNYSSWVYRPEAKSRESVIKKIIRLADSYLPLTGYRIVRPVKYNTNMLNIPASSFLRPYSRKLFFLEKLKLGRIKKEMEIAAKKNAIYHLWWHPHNFGKDMNKNFEMLEKIIQHYHLLKSRYGMQTLTMAEIYKSSY